MGLRRTADPATEPISVESAKLGLKVDESIEDGLIGEWIAVAREDGEDFQNRAWITQTWIQTLDHFPGWCICGRADGGCNLRKKFDGGAIKIPRPPLQSITSIKYLGMNDALDANYDSAYDSATTLHTLNSALLQVDTSSQPGRIAMVNGLLWPYTRLPILAPVLNAVTIEFKAGYGDSASDLPASCSLVVRLALGHFFANRESVLTGPRAVAIEVPGFKGLLYKERIEAF